MPDGAENLPHLETRFVENPSHCWESQFAEAAGTRSGEVAENLVAGVESLLGAKNLAVGAGKPPGVVAQTLSAAVEDRLQSLAVAGNLEVHPSA